MELERRSQEGVHVEKQLEVTSFIQLAFSQESFYLTKGYLGSQGNGISDVIFFLLPLHITVTKTLANAESFCGLVCWLEKL